MGDANRDQSMEEILASIKRVIADEGRPSAIEQDDEPVVPGHPEIVEEGAVDDILELDNPVTEADAIISERSTSASRNALSALTAARSGRETDAVAPVAAPATGDAALEAVVRDMLKPMLKEWLDERLPDMIEQMVAREIARITGRDI